MCNAARSRLRGRQNRWVPQPEQPNSRRAARLAAAASSTTAANRASADRTVGPRRGAAFPLGRFGLIAVVAIVAIGLVALFAVLARPGVDQALPGGTAPAAANRPDAVALPGGSTVPEVATALPVPAQSGPAAASCDDSAVTSALASGRDADVIAAFGGGAAFRAAVAGGAAPCIDLGDPHRVWIVVDKRRPLNPIDFEPAEVIAPANMQRTVDGRLQPPAADALTALVAAAADEGVGAIGLNSAYRSYASQTRTYNGYVNSLGRAEADRQSARPGYSEHQTGLATDVAACDGGCGAIESFGATRQGAWTAANAWRFGFIIRYEDGYTDVSGYQAEPWHLRYIGPELAKAYHEGGFHTLEDFFGLPAAPDY